MLSEHKYNIISHNIAWNNPVPIVNAVKLIDIDSSNSESSKSGVYSWICSFCERRMFYVPVFSVLVSVSCALVFEEILITGFCQRLCSRLLEIKCILCVILDHNLSLFQVSFRYLQSFWRNCTFHHSVLNRHELLNLSWHLNFLRFCHIIYILLDADSLSW